MTVIAHTTDLSGDDTAAFQHACALAAASGARLVTVHGNPDDDAAARLPDAAGLARRWGRPIDHDRRCHECCDEVADTVVDAVRRIAPRLVVAGTHARHGLAALFRGSIAEAIARNVDAATLIVPNTARGFVDPATGAIDLRRILIAAGDPVETERGVAAARAFAALAGARDPELVLVHVEHAPIADALVAEATSRRACLIVMTTHGHDGVLDAIRGSRTEHVVRDAGCPVLSVPIGPAGHPTPASSPATA